MKALVEALRQALEALLGGLSTPTTSKPSGPPTGVSDVSLIKEFEGLYLEAYLCPANKWTIGYGHTKTVRPGMKITERGAEELLRQDLAWCEDAVRENVKVPLTQNQFDALVSFVFNVGEGAFKKSTLLKKLNAGDYEGAANELLRWTRGGGKVLKGLVRRREAERQLFLAGDG